MYFSNLLEYIFSVFCPRRPHKPFSAPASSAGIGLVRFSTCQPLQMHSSTFLRPVHPAHLQLSCRSSYSPHFVSGSRSRTVFHSIFKISILSFCIPRRLLTLSAIVRAPTSTSSFVSPDALVIFCHAHAIPCLTLPVFYLLQFFDGLSSFQTLLQELFSFHVSPQL